MKYTKNNLSIYLLKTAVILPHNDDEFFISPILHHLRKDTVFIFLTHGSAWSTGKSNIRKQESLKFVSQHGFSDRNIINLGETIDIKDGNLFNHIRIATSRLDEIMVQLNIESLFVTAYEGGHHDHDVAFVVANSLAAKFNVPLFDFPLYNANRTSFFRVMDNQNIQCCTYKKKHCYKSKLSFRIQLLSRVLIYRSQWKTFLGLLPGLVRNFLFKENFIIGEVESLLLHKRPHEGPLFYEKRFNMRFENIIKSIEENIIEEKS